jgi:hypothetical protein
VSDDRISTQEELRETGSPLDPLHREAGGGRRRHNPRIDGRNGLFGTREEVQIVGVTVMQVEARQRCAAG